MHTIIMNVHVHVYMYTCSLSVQRLIIHYWVNKFKFIFSKQSDTKGQQVQVY